METYANENQEFHEITKFDKLFKKDDEVIDFSVLAKFIPGHKTNPKQKEVREHLWDLIDDNGNGLLSYGETHMGLFHYFKDHPAIEANEKRHNLIKKAFDLAKDWYPDTTNKKGKKKKAKK